MTVDVINPYDSLNRGYYYEQKGSVSPEEEAIIKSGSLYMVSLIDTILNQIEEVLHGQLKVMDHREEEFSKEQKEGHDKIAATYQSLTLIRSLSIIGAGIGMIGAFMDQTSTMAKVFSFGEKGVTGVEKVLDTFSQKKLQEWQKDVEEAKVSSGRLTRDHDGARQKLERLHESLTQAKNELGSVTNKVIS